LEQTQILPHTKRMGRTANIGKNHPNF